ncbi:MAG: SO_0444 family Cu/Zn efflux transporter [Arenicellales bacterium]
MSLYLSNLLDLMLEAAPWLVLGFLIGGLMKALIPTAFLQKHLKGKGAGPIVKATLLGAPLPLCSCGVLPAAMGLRKAGASKPATIAFLVSTPETGVDSVSITYALMGPIMAIARPISALSSALVAGTLVNLFDNSETTPSNNPTANASATTSCCSSKKEEIVEETTSCCSSKAKPEAVIEKVDIVEEKNSCCSTKTDKVVEEKSSCCSSQAKNQAAQPTPASQSFLSRALAGVHYAFTDLMDKILMWLAIGLLFAAAITTWVPANFLAQWGSGLPAMLIMLVAGVPMYICATASTPIAAGLMMAGVSPGAALVLLLAGPATNVGSVGVIAKELGKRAMGLYLLAVCSIAVASGLILDALIAHYGWTINLVHGDHAMVDSRLAWLALAVLLIASAKIIFHKLPTSKGIRHAA